MSHFCNGGNGCQRALFGALYNCMPGPIHSLWDRSPCRRDIKKCGVGQCPLVYTLMSSISSSQPLLQIFFTLTITLLTIQLHVHDAVTHVVHFYQCWTAPISRGVVYCGGPYYRWRCKCTFCAVAMEILLHRGSIVNSLCYGLDAFDSMRGGCERFGVHLCKWKN